MIDRLFGGRRLTCSTVVALTLSACTAKDPIDLPQAPAMSVAQFLARPTPALADEADEADELNKSHGSILADELDVTLGN